MRRILAIGILGAGMALLASCVGGGGLTPYPGTPYTSVPQHTHPLRPAVEQGFTTP